MRGRPMSCCFTGHRSLPSDAAVPLCHALDRHIAALLERGVTEFRTGGALGFDTLAAECIIGLKTVYPHIKLHLYLPCYNQSASWSNEDKYKWHILAAQADDFKYITEGNYSYGCMQKRNRAMVDSAYYGLAYYILEKSGTGATVRYAEQKGHIVENIAESIYEN